MKDKHIPGKLNMFNTWKQSLVGQLLLRFWLCHIIFFTAIGSIQYNALQESLYRSVEQNLTSDYNSAQNSISSWLGSNNLPPGRFAELRPGNFVAIYSVDSKPKYLINSYGRENTDIPEFIKRNQDLNLEEKSLNPEPFVFGDSGEEKYMLLVEPVLSPEQLTVLGYAVFGEPLLEEELILQNNLKNYVFNALLIFLLSTLLTAYALQKPLQPLLNISSTARKIAGGRYDLRLPDQKTASEITQLREALNHMLGQMENALNTERTAKDKMARFIADASHELRTPLTSIRGFLEILQRNDSTDKELLNSAHHTMLIETERLIRLTETLLSLNSISQEEQQPTESPASSLRDVVPELFPLLTPLLGNRILLLNDRNIKGTEDLTSFVPNRIIPLKIDELKQILYNLLHNAIQYTEDKGIISLNTEEENGNFIMVITDNGKGIPAADLAHVYERFFRGDRSRSRTKGQGSGLGLAIVSELVKIRGGEIEAESILGKGTSFRITFPIA